MPQAARALGIVATLAAACAQPIHLVDRAVSGGAPCSFWPPPHATSTWTVELPEQRSFGEVAADLDTSLRRAGYTEQQWFPVGAQFIHGFAVTTRLERINDDATPRPASERWSSVYPEAANLRWLAGARVMTLPARGRYRVLLVTFTDLPIGQTRRAEAWDEETLMEGPYPVPPLPAGRRAPRSFHLGFFVYEYASTRDDGSGAFVASTTP